MVTANDEGSRDIEFGVTWVQVRALRKILEALEKVEYCTSGAIEVVEGCLVEWDAQAGVIITINESGNPSFD